MPRGRPRLNPDDATNGTPSGTPSKMSAVRQALAACGAEAKPPALDKWIRDTYGLVIQHNMISSYKSQMKSKPKKGKGGRLGRPPASESAPAKVAGGTISFKDLHEVKTLAGRLGISNLRKLVEVLS